MHRELAKTYDAYNELNASHADSAQKAVYSKSKSKDCWNELMAKLSNR